MRIHTFRRYVFIYIDYKNLDFRRKWSQIETVIELKTETGEQWHGIWEAYKDDSDDDKAEKDLLVSFYS